MRSSAGERVHWGLLVKQFVVQFFMNKKIQTSLRMSQEAKRLLKQLSEKLGVSQSAIIELAIRKLAKQEGSK